jgi:hypothetical protein
MGALLGENDSVNRSRTAFLFPGIYGVFAECLEVSVQRELQPREERANAAGRQRDTPPGAKRLMFGPGFAESSAGQGVV